MTGDKINPITAVKIEKALKLLDENLQLIPNVQAWAQKAGVSREWLYKSMKIAHNKSPKIILREMRYEKVIWMIGEQGVETCCYSVAVDAGFRDGIALSKFLSSYYDTNFTSLKIEIIQGEEHLNFQWLNGIHK